MRCFVTGWDGLLGSSLVPILREAHEVTGIGIADGEITDRALLRARLAAARPEVVVHLAAMTAVDRCETEPAEAFRVNGEGTRRVVEAVREIGARLVALSTDYVFDGAAGRPYRESDPVAPLGVYGKSKLEAERAVATLEGEGTVVRSAWLFGPKGSNFVETILTLLESRETVGVVEDQRGCPTYTPDLARALRTVVERAPGGVFHLAGGESATWYDLAREAVSLAGGDPARIRPVSTEAFGRPAPRPRYSVLDCAKASREMGIRLAPWRDALERFLAGRTGAKETRT